MAEARRRGHGFKVRDWSALLPSTHSPADVVENVVDWCKEVLAECRRPYGVDHFDLAVAFRLGTNGPVRKVSFNRSRIRELYDGSLPAELLSHLTAEVRRHDVQHLRLSAGVFSWGEALHVALPKPEQA